MFEQKDVRRLRTLVRMKQIELAFAAEIDPSFLSRAEIGYVQLSESQLRDVEKVLRSTAKKLVKDLAELAA